jgi:hypothetical protein
VTNLIVCVEVVMSTAAPSSRPTSVTWSFIIWLITVLLQLIAAIFLFILVGTAGTLAVAGSGSGGLIVGALIATAAIGLVFAIVELIIVFKMRDGRNWARIVLTILAVLQIISTLVQGGNNSFISWIGFATLVIATVLMFVPASNQYFSRRGVVA